MNTSKGLCGIPGDEPQKVSHEAVISDHSSRQPVLHLPREGSSLSEQLQVTAQSFQAREQRQQPGATVYEALYMPFIHATGAQDASE